MLGELPERIRNFLAWTGNPEQEQAAIRIAILAAILGYLSLNRPESADHLLIWSSGLKIVYVLLILSLAIYESTILWPGSSQARRVIAILDDSIGTSCALFVTGPIGAPWYGVYLWVILGNGFRYGEKYLYLATAISLAGFSVVATSTPFWITNSGLAIGFACTLLLIPAYSAILIRRLNEARQRADAASRAKTDFLSCMSHEIRTPLNGILGMTDLLRLRPLSREDRDCIETIHVSAHALARQINEILDLSKIEAGRITIETVEFDLYVLVTTTLRIFQSQAQEKALILRSLIDPLTPYRLSGDPHKIRQIITNLIGNSLKFTHTGSITLRITPISSEETSTLLRFEVTDTGTGIAQDKLKVIFNPFTQANESISRNYGGTGLGTTISKNLVELMGGTIGVESTLDVGTTFWFEIPFNTHKNQTDGNIANWASHCRAIYASPISPEIDLVQRKLGEWGVQFDASNTIEDAYKKATSSDVYDVLIASEMPTSPILLNIADGTDVNLPSNLYTIIIDSERKFRSSQHDRQSLFVIDSPMENNLLLNALHACYSRHGTEEEIVHFAHQQSRAKNVDRRLNILVSDDNSINRIVMQRMLDKLGHRHTIVSGGEAALLALEKDNFDAVFLDKNMPDMGGIEVFQAFRLAHAGNSPVEFAILTADATEDARNDCTSAGIRHFLTKPVSLDRLTEALSNMCGSTSDVRNQFEVALNSAPALTLSQEILDEAEFEKLSELSGGNSSFLRELVDNFIDDTNRNLRALEVAVAKRDRPSFCDVAHALKGSARYLGLTQIAELAKDAQNISEEDFRNKGTGTVVLIKKAVDAAGRLLSAKLTNQRTGKAVC